MSDLNIRAAITLNYAHVESQQETPDLKKLNGMLYEAIHLSGFHPDAWFAAYMCYRRTGQARAMERAWREAIMHGDAEHYRDLASKYH